MAPTIGFHASHEQFAPSRLLRLVKQAEQAGFQHIQSSDHIEPWGVEQGESGFAFAWLGAAMQSTNLNFTLVNAPGDRYHPAVVAQAIATLEEMFPGRFSVALGSGEAMNEHITGNPWPPKHLRNQRLGECAAVIRRLLDGERVTYDGMVTVHDAKVWSRPETPPPLYVAALSPETARWAGTWADGLITVNQPEERMRAVADAFHETAGEKPLLLQVHVCWAENEDTAAEMALESWKGNMLPGPVAQDVRLAEHFDMAAQFIKQEDVSSVVDVSSDPGWHADNLLRYAGLGFSILNVHHVGPTQEQFVDFFGDKVLPQIRIA
ncbi:MAG TPA: TIGR03885 family FMN-dependent LLM class oxidoreductase [Actinomycetota bacterium]|nr:TIGR03885 family FMN-dependent LLM class oxidoreductase [Actinomycetota bacterium]